MFLSSYVSKKEVLHGYRGGGGHVFFAKYTLNLDCIYPIFSVRKNIDNIFCAEKGTYSTIQSLLE
jgi:hypothetical protein